MLPAPASRGGNTSVEQLDADAQPQTHQPIHQGCSWEKAAP